MMPEFGRTDAAGEKFPLADWAFISTPGPPRPALHCFPHSKQVRPPGGTVNTMGARQGRPALDQEEIKTFAKSSGLSVGEVQETFASFVERHPNGKLKPKDFGEIMSTALPKKDANKISKHAFRIYDLNNDGYIDFKEFMVVYFVLAEGEPRDVLEKLFRLFDVNGDGAISQKELSRLVKDMYGLLKRDNPGLASEEMIAKTAFAEMDVNGDGKITEAEFVTACLGQEEFSSLLSTKALEIFMDDLE